MFTSLHFTLERRGSQYFSKKIAMCLRLGEATPGACRGERGVNRVAAIPASSSSASSSRSGAAARVRCYARIASSSSLMSSSPFPSWSIPATIARASAAESATPALSRMPLNSTASSRSSPAS